MIEGFKLRVTSQEIKGHCVARAEHHRQRADTKESTLPALRAAAETLMADMNPQGVSHMNKFSSSTYAHDPRDGVENLENDIRDHRNKAVVFDFFAGHLFDDDYTLLEADLIRLEILKR